MRVLTIANPLFPLGSPQGTGAEHVATMLDCAIAASGWTSLTIAEESSQVAGKMLLGVPQTNWRDPFAVNQVEEKIRECVWRAADGQVDLIHFHGVAFDRYLPPPGTVSARLVATIHSSRSHYHPAALARPDVRRIAVSHHLAASLGGWPPMQVIGNGIDLNRYRPGFGKRENLVMIARVCADKGTHVGLRVAKRLAMPLVVAGAVHPFPSHQEYFEREVRPLLDPTQRHYAGAISTEEKIALLSTARCLLLPSMFEETSSLAAMEAISCGVPVIAFPSGALPEVIEHGMTGFLVRSEDEMVEAIGRVHEISPLVLRQRAELRFDARRMAAQYLKAYREPGLAPAR